MFNIQNSLNAREVPFYCQNQYGISLNRSCPSFTNSNPLNPYQAISLPHPMNNVQCAIPQFTYNGKAKISASPFIINQNEKKTYVKRKHTNAPRKKFSQEEDEKLKNLVESMGSKKWEQIAKEMPGRTGRQCRDRYQNYLIPGYFNGQWSKMEDDLLLKLFVQYGSQWSKMAQFFSNRSANSLKNRYNYIRNCKIYQENCMCILHVLSIIVIISLFVKDGGLPSGRVGFKDLKC